jgi:hypothetical protein
VVCLALIFTSKTAFANDELHDNWYAISRHGECVLLKTLFSRDEELHPVITLTDLVNNLKNSGHDVKVVNLLKKEVVSDDSQPDSFAVGYYSLASKSKSLHMILASESVCKSITEDMHNKTQIKTKKEPSQLNKKDKN